MLNIEIKKKSILFAASLLSLALILSSFSSFPFSLQRISAYDEDYFKYVVSNTTTSSNASSIANSKIDLPKEAIGPSIPSKGYLVQEIGDHLYAVSDGVYNTMFLVTEKGVVAVDAPPSLGEKYLRAIADVTDKPVYYVIYSHAHLDHIDAAGLFPRNATIIAQDETAHELQNAKKVAANASMVPPIPTITFSKNYTLNIGNQTLNLDYYGVNHLPGNIFIYAPK
jgi:hypothetical protein